MAEMQTSHSHHNFNSHRNRFLTLIYILHTMLLCRPAGAIVMPLLRSYEDHTWNKKGVSLSSTLLLLLWGG